MTAHPTDAHGLWAVWSQAARLPVVSQGLGQIYDRLAEEIAALGPVCELSGRCCRFESFDHRLYATGLEIAWLVDRLDEPGRDRLCDADLPNLDGCPFQVEGRCSEHAHRPVGCRIFYCDPNAQAWQQPKSEACLRELGKLHESHGLPYRYMEWRHGLAEVRAWIQGGV